MNITSWLGHVLWCLVSSSAQTLISTSSNFTIIIIILANNSTLIPYLPPLSVSYFYQNKSNIISVCVFCCCCSHHLLFFAANGYCTLCSASFNSATLRVRIVLRTHSHTLLSFFFLNFFSKCAHCSGHLKPFCLAHFLLVVRLNNQT